MFVAYYFCHPRRRTAFDRSGRSCISRVCALCLRSGASSIGQSLGILLIVSLFLCFFAAIRPSHSTGSSTRGPSHSPSSVLPPNCPDYPATITTSEHNEYVTDEDAHKRTDYKRFFSVVTTQYRSATTSRPRSALALRSSLHRPICLVR